MKSRRFFSSFAIFKTLSGWGRYCQNMTGSMPPPAFGTCMKKIERSPSNWPGTLGFRSTLGSSGFALGPRKRIRRPTSSQPNPRTQPDAHDPHHFVPSRRPAAATSPLSRAGTGACPWHAARRLARHRLATRAVDRLHNAATGLKEGAASPGQKHAQGRKARGKQPPLGTSPVTPCGTSREPLPRPPGTRRGPVGIRGSSGTSETRTRAGAHSRVNR